MACVFTIASFVTYTLLPCSGNDINEVRKSAASPIELKNINRAMFYFFSFEYCDNTALP